jgi:short-subunit dehydrogenase
MDNVAVITGGSSGIGLALAKQFASQGFNLLLVARDPAKMDDAKNEILKLYPKIQVETYLKDLREDTAAEDVYGYCRENNIVVEALCNNAGVGTYGAFSESYIDDNENIVQLDITTMINLTYLFIHGMIERGHGYVLNTASTAAFQCGPFMDVYYASKAFVLSFTEGLHEELLHSGVKVSALCPGPTDTPFRQSSGFEKAKIRKVFPLKSPEEVAATAYKGLLKNKAVIIPGGKNKLRAFDTRLFSRGFIRRAMRKMLSPVPKESEKK